MAKEQKTAEPQKSPEQLLREYDDACADIARAWRAMAEEERKPRTSPAHALYFAARERKRKAAIAAQPHIDARNHAAERKAAATASHRQASEQANIDANFAAQGGVDVTAEKTTG